jgi:thymidylate synthase ThyX
MTWYAFLIQRDHDPTPFAVIWSSRELAEQCKDRVSEICPVTFEEIADGLGNKP